MIALVLASWLLTQEWAWSESPTAAAYRVYWTERLDVWCSENRIDVTAVCLDGDCRADWTEPVNSTFYTIVAVSSGGTESVWEVATPRTECFP